MNYRYTPPMNESQNSHSEWKKSVGRVPTTWFHLIYIPGNVNECIVTESRSAALADGEKPSEDYQGVWGNLWGWWVCLLSWLWWQFHKCVHMLKHQFEYFTCVQFFVNYTSKKLFLRMSTIFPLKKNKSSDREINGLWSTPCQGSRRGNKKWSLE